MDIRDAVEDNLTEEEVGVMAKIKCPKCNKSDAVSKVETDKETHFVCCRCIIRFKV